MSDKLIQCQRCNDSGFVSYWDGTSLIGESCSECPMGEKRSRPPRCKNCRRALAEHDLHKLRVCRATLDSAKSVIRLDALLALEREQLERQLQQRTK